MSRNATSTVTGTCPGCDEVIYFRKRPHRGQLVTCPDCGDLLQVVADSPVELDWVPDDEEWEDEH